MPEDVKQSTMTFGQRCQWARSTAGLTQVQAAKLLKISKFEINEIEEGRCALTDAFIDQLSEVYSVSVDWLTKGIERPVDTSFLGWDVSDEDRERVRRVFARSRQI